MYNPKIFSESDQQKIADCIVEFPLASIICDGESRLESYTLPLLLKRSANQWHLHGHISNSNPLVQIRNRNCLVLFRGPEHYISPEWYPQKQVNEGKVVPTWNYIEIQLRGTLNSNRDVNWLRQHVSEFVEQMESRVGQHWRLQDAPESYIEKMLAAITGVEIAVESIEGKWKVGQNRVNSDKLGVAAALEALGNDKALALRKQLLDYLE